MACLLILRGFVENLSINSFNKLVSEYSKNSILYFLKYIPLSSLHNAQLNLKIIVKYYKEHTSYLCIMLVLDHALD